MHKMVDNCYCLDQCVGPVSDGHTISAFLQRPHRLSEGRGKLTPPPTNCLFNHLQEDGIQSSLRTC